MKNYIKIIGAISAIIAILCCLLIFRTNNQATMAIPLELEFIGEYNQGTDEWFEYTKESDISALDGDLIIRGHFNEDVFADAIINMYCNHIGISVYVNEEPVFIDYLTEVKNYGMNVTPSMCGKRWEQFIVPEISSKDTMEIRFINHHEHGNSQAFEEAISNIYIAPNDNQVLPHYLEPYIAPFNVVGYALLVISVLLLGGAICALVLKTEMYGPLFMIAAITGLMSGYILSDIMTIYITAERLDIKTYGRQICMMLAMFLIIINGSDILEGKTKKVSQAIAGILGIINIVILAIAITGRVLIFDMQLPWIVAQFVACVILIVVHAIAIKKYNKFKIDHIAYIILLMSVILDIAGVGYNIYSPGICAKISFTLIIIVYIIRGAKRIFDNYYASVKNRKLQEELEKSRIAVMISQIQPHFLYNSLTSVMDLCDRNPKQAKNAIADFADYLRGNMEALNTKELIPFHRELEHIEKYLRLEKLRFQEDIQIEYDIQTENFTLPPLSVQPLVENSIKHGIGKKPGGGTVTIRTKETAEAYIIAVCDNGVGFDEGNYRNDGVIHVGLDNIRWRLNTMLGAHLEIDSKIGKGTMATIHIPKRRD